MHYNIKYSYFSETKSIFVLFTSDKIKTQFKLSAQKTWNPVIIEYFLKDRYMKEFVSAMDIITNFSIEEIIISFI